MATVELSEGVLHYLELGAGPPLVLVHGWPVSSVYWRENALKLADHFRVLAVDLPGFGRSFSPHRTGCSARQQADRLAEFIETVAGEPVFLAGHSMGGMVSSVLAPRRPDLIRKLVLIVAPLEGPTGLSAICMLGRFAFARRIASWALRLGWLLRAVSPWFAHAVSLPESVLHECTVATPESVRLALESLTHDGTREQLAAISMPTLVIGADRDRIVHPLQPLLAKGWIPGARLEVFRDCGHCPNLEYPALFEGLLKEFLLSPPDRAC